MEDQKILSLYEQRLESAIGYTKEKYGRLLFSLAYRILRDFCDSEECENDTYLAAWNSIPPKHPENLCAYLLRIVRNQALKKYRFRCAEKRSFFREVSLEEVLEPELGTMAESQNEDDVLAECVNSFLEQLSPEARRVLVQKYWYFMSAKEIAQDNHMSKSKVESMLFRTRRKLKQYLLERGFSYDR